MNLAADQIVGLVLIGASLIGLAWSAVLTHQDNKRAAFDEHVDTALAHLDDA